MTIFAKIIDGEIPSDKVFENDRILAFKDINPVAPVHLLIIPKKKDLANLQAVSEEDLPLMAEIMQVAQKLAEEFGVADGYRLLTNVGPNSGQEVYHIHFHLIGGHKLRGIG